MFQENEIQIAIDIAIAIDIEIEIDIDIDIEIAIPIPIGIKKPVGYTVIEILVIARRSSLKLLLKLKMSSLSNMRHHFPSFEEGCPIGRGVVFMSISIP